MRPVQKNEPGNTLPSGRTIQSTYAKYGDAYPDLEENIGRYCSYCEIFSTDLEIEHVVSKYQDDTLKNSWSNFLLSCGRCNGGDNKSNKHVDIQGIYFPHLNNTLLIFEYKEGGFIAINSSAVNDPIQRNKAVNLMDLVGLDKYEGNPKYSTILPRDIRWKGRRIAWELAVRYLADYEAGERSAADIADFAAQRGFFSIWFTVFANQNEVKKVLIDRFKGTAENCFDKKNGCKPIPRNKDKADPI
jgi:HNH endonuclease